MSTFTLKQLRDREFDLLEIGEPWRSAVGRIEQKAYGLVHGPAGVGKSTLLLGFAGHELTRHGAVFFNSSEEGEGVTLQGKADRLNLTSYDRLTFGEYSDVDGMLMAAARAGADFIVVDSITDMGATREELADLKEHCKAEGVGLWVIVQETKEGQFRGPSNLEYDTDIVARVVDEGVLQTSKNRYEQVQETRVPFSEEDLREMGGSTGDGQATRENPTLRVGKLDDHGANEPGRLDQAWTGESIDLPFDVKPWHRDPDAFIERFSLGGVEFGRWMEADDRARFMAWAAQSFNDFCDLFGLAYTRAGFDGRIKIALGARGRGGRVAAHYEPTPRHTINLTKPHGKGSLAHEYAHALDNMAGVRFGLKTYASGGRSERTDTNKKRLAEDGILGDLERFFAALYFEKANDGGFVEREWARQLHHADTRDYYKRRTEVLARSLETYVRQLLDEHMGGGWNTWLAKRESAYLSSGVYPQKYILGDGAGRHLCAFVRALFSEEIEMRENPAPAAGDVRENPGAACLVKGEWTRNEEKEGVEIRFSDPPPPAVRERLRDHGFIFAFKKQMWFADATGENVALAKELIGEGTAAAARSEEAPPLPSGVQGGTMDLDVEGIVVDPERFQPREEAYSEETARKVAEDFDPQKMEPIRVWNDPERGGWHVLAGFSRLEGYRRRGEDTIPARAFEGTEQGAVRFAWEENEKGDGLTNTERAAYLRMLRDTDDFTLGELRAKAKDLYGRDARRILALSFLNPKGKALETLRQLKGNAAGDYNAAETMATWTGKVRRYNRDFTDSHEREIYNFLLGNYKSQGKGFTTASGFREFVEEVKSRRSFMGTFDASEPLNFAEIVPKSAQEEHIDRLVREARAEFRQTKKALDEERKTYIERGADRAELKRILTPYQDAVDAAQAHVIEVEQEARNGRTRLKLSEQNLFETLQEEQPRENPAHIDGFLTRLGSCIELETTEALFQAEGEGTPMFTGPEGHLLIIVPAWRVKPVREQWAEGAAAAAELYETWHGFAPDADVSIELPSGTWERAGDAERIQYRSDKIMQAGDAKGNENTYEHHFDAGEREVYEWGDCLVIARLMIDRRGILN